MMRMFENIGNVAAAFAALAMSVGLIVAAFAPGLTAAPGFLA
jgi:hypothetical protein